MSISSRKVICVSLAHIIFGTLMTVCGVLQVILQLKFLWLDSFYTGIWVGIWMSFTGILGVIASFRIKFFVALFMFFSITSSLLGLASVSYYANTGAASWDVYWSSRYYLIISSATCLFAIVQVITGVVAGIYSCLAFGDDTQSEQASVVSSNKVVPINNAGPVSDDDRMSAQDNQVAMVQMQDAQE